MPGFTDDSGVRAASRPDLREGKGALEALGEGDGAIRRRRAAGMPSVPLDEAAPRAGHDVRIFRAFVTLSGYVPGHSIRAAPDERACVRPRPDACSFVGCGSNGVTWDISAERHKSPENSYVMTRAGRRFIERNRGHSGGPAASDRAVAFSKGLQCALTLPRLPQLMGT